MNISIPSILIANSHNLITSTSDLAISTITSTNSSNLVATIASFSSPAISIAINTSNNFITFKSGNFTISTLFIEPSSFTANLRKERNFLKILADLITPSKEIFRVSSSEEKSNKNAILSLVQLYNKAKHSQKYTILANYAKIWSWYRFAKVFED
ncbi:9926_t:CDS:1 [Dentiscutata heterogama]|uniref:9926_t:CDS:1 n=1 Tax=Dentiscutata heterogama TaxID=1316150 RepID=A0ACA9KAT6_9GLOM|nr:9926_t:CDS:1 [Dentiscutata heterogama]